MDTEGIDGLMVARWEGGVGNWWRGEGIKKDKKVVTEQP